MSKTVYLLAHTGSAFIQFGPGCALGIQNYAVVATGHATLYLTKPDTKTKQVDPLLALLAPTLAEKSLTEEQITAGTTALSRLAVWQQAIIGAPDGALLRWDDERQQVVDELAEDEATFAEEHLLDTQSGAVQRHDSAGLGSPID